MDASRSYNFLLSLSFQGGDYAPCVAPSHLQLCMQHAQFQEELSYIKRYFPALHQEITLKNAVPDPVQICLATAAREIETNRHTKDILVTKGRRETVLQRNLYPVIVLNETTYQPLVTSPHAKRFESVHPLRGIQGCWDICTPGRVPADEIVVFAQQQANIIALSTHYLKETLKSFWAGKEMLQEIAAYNEHTEHVLRGFH